MTKKIKLVTFLDKEKKNIDKEYEQTRILYKNGGKYINKIGIIKRIDSVNEIIKFSDNSIIKMNDVINISSDIFNSIF